MKPKPPLSSDAAALRRRAEASLREQHPEAGPARNEAETGRLLHELQVHQIEMEMQNLELQQANETVESEKEKYSDLYDFAPVGYVTLDHEGTIHETNLACSSLLGIERSRLVRRRFGLFVSPAGLPEFNDFLKKVFAGESRESCEVSLPQEGKPPVEVRMEAVAAASGQECRVVVTDLTERKRAEADRLVLSKLESTRILAGGIAHDFNNLHAVILMNLELGLMLAPAGEELALRMEQAKKAALLAGSLAQQLTTFAEGGAPVRKPTSLSAVIRESARLTLSGSRVLCEFLLPPDLWPVEADAGQIGQVIRNLALNAREAMPGGGLVIIRAENVILNGQKQPSLPPGEYVHLSITDRGGGVAKEVLPKIFDPYYSTKHRGVQKGMGLGLTIGHSIMQKHGGAISVESEAGMGATFHIHLPACRKTIVLEKAAASKEFHRPGRILLMDDEEGVRTMVGATLRRMGHEVELAEDGQRAVEIYRNAKDLGQPFDAVILDLTVRAGMGGQETIQALLRLDPKVKAIVMSGYAGDPVVLEYEQHGFKGALAKPFDYAKLQEILSQVMGNGSGSQATP